MSTPTSSFRLVNRIESNEAAGDVVSDDCAVPVRKYVSSRSGMRLYVCQVAGPVLEGYFSLATETLDDDGLPHTLEHMIFLGSEEYPYSGVLDLLANVVFADGTNAWTDVDNTTYTLSTAEKTGFLQLLPIYLDHIFYPLLTESGFITEVYHIDGEGRDSGVVYSEMQANENDDETVVERAILKELYPDPECGYRYETGGVLRNLRDSCSHEKVIKYHKKMYKPNNIAIIVAGEVEDSEVIEVLENFESKMLGKSGEGFRLDERPFTRPVTPLSHHVDKEVYFPVDDESNSNGLVSIAWHGPSISNLKELIALDILLNYLTDSSISPLRSHFVDSKSYCNKITYRVTEYLLTYISVSFVNAQLSSLEKIKGEFYEIIRKLVDKQTPFDLSRVANIIKMKISEIHDKFEDEPHSAISLVCIGDFLYGHDDNPAEFRSRFCQTKVFKDLSKESADFWIALLKNYMLDAFSVTIVGKPSETLKKEIEKQDQERVDERKKRLGKKGLSQLQKRVDNAQAQNDDTDVPDEVFERLKVPSLDGIKFKQVTQFSSFLSQDPSASFAPVGKGFNNFADMKHLPLHIDNLDGTNFVQAFMILDTSNLSVNLRPYLLLLSNLLFELPVENSELKMSHEEVVFELNKDLLEYESCIGLNGSQFDPGSFANYFSVFTKTSMIDYDLAVRWLKLIVFDSVFDKKQIKVAVMNMLKEIKTRKQEPSDLMKSILSGLYFKQDSNISTNNLIKQEDFLTQILSEIESISSTESKLDVQLKLEELKTCLLTKCGVKFYLCTDLTKLFASNRRGLDLIWIESFPSTLPCFDQKLKLELTWNSKKEPENMSKQATLYSVSPKSDFLVKLGSTESSFLKLISSTDIKSYNDPRYAGILVLIEYFCQTEGPLWEAVRGPGYAYSQSIYLNPDKALVDLSLYECSNLSKAYESTKELFNDYMDDESNFDEQMLESAKNSLIFQLIDDVKSVSGYSSYSLSCIFKETDLNCIPNLIKEVEKIKLESLSDLLKKYIMPLFNDDYSNCLIVCHSAKSETIHKDFVKKFNRKPVVVEKISECF